MSTSNNGPPVSLQKSVISSNLNGTLLSLFLVGAYSVLYAATITKSYFGKASSRGVLVISCLAGLYATVALEVALQWYYTRADLSLGKTRMEIYRLNINDDRSRSIDIIQQICVPLGPILADWLMVWRSFHVCGGSYVRISPLIFLYTAQIALSLARIVYIILFLTNPEVLTIQSARLYNSIVGSSLFATSATSLLATWTIGYRVYSSTKHGQRLRGKYTHIVDIIAQSSAIYSLLTLFEAILAVIAANETISVGQIISYISGYVTPMCTLTTGLAPTFMVVRLAIAKEESEDDGGFSTSRFSIPGLHDLEEVSETVPSQGSSIAGMLEPSKDTLSESL